MADARSSESKPSAANGVAVAEEPNDDRAPPPLQVADAILSSGWAHERAARPLRVTCYGSSSSATPSKYLQEALHAGYLLARRGHVCVNGAGSYGCMAALNDGASLGNGHIVGVIHEMWLVDGENSNNNSKTAAWEARRKLRDGGAHGVFASLSQSPANSTGEDDGAPTSGPIREMLVAGGQDLQERKRLLVDKTDALLVLPGGPGTWDELWEMACARNIGLTATPIVCVNTEGYYDPFRLMLERAHRDQLTKLEPHDILHFAETAEEAVRWIEESVAHAPTVALHKRATALRSSSVLSVPVVGDNSTLSSWFSVAIRRATSWVSEPSSSSKHRPSRHGSGGDQNIQDAATSDRSVKKGVPLSLQGCALFGAGMVFGVLLASRRRR